MGTSAKTGGDSSGGWLLVGIAGLAAFMFLWQLGSSSFFIDEAASMRIIDTPVGDLLGKLRVAENSPPGYFLLLLAWTNLIGSDAEWAARLPSAVAAIVLVAAVWRLGYLVDDKRTGLLAALLVAVSPLVLQYAQQARTYTLAMLALTLGTIAAVKATQLRSWTSVLLGAVAFSVALSLHYVTVLVVAPVCLWVLWRRTMAPAMRFVFCAFPALTWLAWLPLALLQRSDHPSSQLAEYGTFTIGHAVRVLGAPFDDRYTTDVGPLKVIAAAIVVAAIAAVAVRNWHPKRSELQLIVGLVVVSVLGLLAGSVVGFEILNSRYMTFALPFMVVVLASAVRHTRPALSLPVLGVLLLTALVSDIGSHRREGFYPDTRGVIDATARSWRVGDVLLDDTTLGVQFPLRWYAETRLPAHASMVHIADPAAQRVIAKRRRLWIVRLDPPLREARTATPPGYRTHGVRRFVGSVDLTLELATPSTGD